MNPVDPLLFAQYPFCGYSSTLTLQSVPSNSVRLYYVGPMSEYCPIVMSSLCDPPNVRFS